MTKNAIIIHGTCGEDEYFSDKYPSLTNSHWFPWLQKQLLIKRIFTQTPEMFETYKPDYKKWKKEFERSEMYSLVTFDMMGRVFVCIRNHRIIN